MGQMRTLREVEEREDGAGDGMDRACLFWLQLLSRRVRGARPDAASVALKGQITCSSAKPIIVQQLN